MYLKKLFNKIKHFSKRRLAATFLMLIILISISAFIYVKLAFGATRTWDGGGTEGTCPGNSSGWSCAQNWSADTIPGAADLAQFDGTNTKDSNIDAGYAGSVGGIDINSGYTGTITQSRSLTVGSQNFDQAAGTWNGGSQTLDINDGNFVVSGGIHTATTGTWTIERNFTYSGGTLTMSGATPTIDDSNSTDDSTLTCSTTIGGTFTVTKDDGGDFTLAAGCTATFGVITMTAGLSAAGVLTINGSLTGTDITIYGNMTVGSAGTLDLSGAITVGDTNSAHDSTLTCSTALGETFTVTKDDGGDFTLAAGCTATFGVITMTAGLSAAGALTVNGSLTGTDITIYGNMTVGSSARIALSGVITASGTNSAHDTTISCTGILSPTINVDKTSAGNGDFTLSSGCIATFGTFTSTSTFASVAAPVTINGTANGSTMTIYGDLTVGSNGTLNFSTVDFGDSAANHDSTLTCTGRINPNVTINVVKDSTGNGDFTLASGCTATFGTFTSTTGNAVAGSVTINGRALGTDMTVYGDLTVGLNGKIDFSGNINIGDNVGNSDTILTCTGTLGPTVNVVKDGLGNGDFTLASGCTATFGTFTSSTGNAVPGFVTINGKAIGTDMTVYGDLTIGSAGYVDFSGTITNGGGVSNNDTILTCNGSIINGNFVLNKTDPGATLVLGSSCTIPGNFTRTDGPINNPSSPTTLTVNGNFSTSTTDAWGGANLTLKFGGTGNNTITQNAGVFITPIQISKSGGTMSLSTNFLTSAAATVSAGFFDINGQTFITPQSLTLQDGGGLKLIGSESPPTPIINSGSTVSYKGASGTNSYTIKNWSYSNLEIAQAAGANTFNLPADLTIGRNVNIISGTLDTASGSNFNLTVAGNWGNVGTFTARSGTVTFNDNSKPSIITGATTFNNLTSTTANKRFVFANASTQTISGALTLTGARGQNISLTSKTAGTQWNIVSNGTASLSYLEVKDSNACSGTTLVPTNSTNLGNNSCWTMNASTGTNDIKINAGTKINQGTIIRGL